MKKFCLFVLFFVIFLGCSGFVFAAPQNIIYYEESGTNFVLRGEYIVDEYESAYAHAADLVSECYIYYVNLTLRDVYGTGAVLYGGIWSNSGSNLPDVLLNSSSNSVSELTSSYVVYRFDFNVSLDAGLYWFGLYVNNKGGMNSTWSVDLEGGSNVNHVRLAYDSVWHTSGTAVALDILVRGDYDYVEPTPTPVPTPTPTVSPSPTPYVPTTLDILIEDLMNYIVYLLVLLVPALLLWWKGGKWGFFVGLICGAVISYLFLGFAQNFWGLVLIGVIIVIAVVANTRGGS